MKSYIPKFDNFLCEGSLPSQFEYSFLLNLMQDYMSSMYTKYCKKWPDDIKKMDEYMEGELTYTQWAMLPLLDALKDGRVTNEKKRPEKLRVSIKKACYYNALSYIKQYKDKYPNIELAWGIMIENFPTYIDGLKKYAYDDSVSMRPGLNTTIHAFCVLDGKIVDPTLTSNDIYMYEIVSQKTWEQFNWKENDTNFDARDFYSYIFDKRLAYYKEDKKLINLLTKKINYV